MSRPLTQSYLLRVWREQPGAPMRFTIIAVGQPDAHRHFGTLAECFAWLYEQSAAPDEPHGSSIHLGGSTTIVSQMEDGEK